jgi:hypothetical protein
MLGKSRETREGWPLLTVGKLRQMGTLGVQMNGLLPWLVRWARCASTRDFFPDLDALVGPVHRTPYTISVHLSPSPSKLAGSRAGSPVFFYVSGEKSINY